MSGDDEIPGDEIGRFENLEPMSLRSFRDEGYLQEANRRFFHPLGLMLAIAMDEDGAPRRLEVHQSSDPAGIVFPEGMIDFDKFNHVASRMLESEATRVPAFGFQVQPVGPTPDD